MSLLRLFPTFLTSFSFFLLLLLCFQTCSHVLVRYYSRGVLHEDYLLSGTVIVGEFIKLLTVLFLILRRFHYSIPQAFNHCSTVMRNSLSLAIPGTLYFIQNFVSVLSSEYLSPASFSIINQTKLLSTAVFAVLILKKTIHVGQWRALTLLIIGVFLVEKGKFEQNTCPTLSPAPATIVPKALAVSNHTHTFNLASSFSVDSNPQGYHIAALAYTVPPALIGTLAALLASLISGLAGVLVELHVKKAAATKSVIYGEENQSVTSAIADTNLQLSAYGILSGILSVLISSDSATFIAEKGFFHGYSFWTMLFIMIGSLGGILVSLVLVYADNILKGFATCFAIILTYFISAAIFDTTGSFDANFLCGSTIVILSAFIYSAPQG